MNRKIRNVTILILCILIVLSVIFFSVIILKNKNTARLTDAEAAASEQSAEIVQSTTDKKIEDTQSALNTENDLTSATTEAVSKITSVCGNKYISSETGRIVVDPDNENWNLIVVNSGREYVSGYKPELAEAVKGSGKYLDKRVAPYYTKMYEAAKKDGLTLTPYSGYRSYDTQKTNYASLTNQYMSQYGLSREEAAKKAATVILPPGTSEHNLGLAMDIISTKDSFAESDEYAWLVKNAYKYGFILRYTAEKQPITGIVPEPWHWRYVGVEYAKKIKDSGLCLEEYLDSLGIEY